MQAHPAGAGLPGCRGRVVAQGGKLPPRLPAVGRLEQGGILNARVGGVRIVQRRLEMPDPGELEGPLRSVVPEVIADGTLVCELVAHRLPRLAAVAGALDHLAEPAAGLRGVDPVRIGGRSLQMVDLPAPEVRAAHIPPLALSVRGQDECALACADQYSYTAHAVTPSRAWANLASSSLYWAIPARRFSLVMRPSPILLLPAHANIAPWPAGAPSNEFFAAGSSFAHGDQACQLWKSLTCVNTAGAGAAMVVLRSMRNSDGCMATISASPPTTSTMTAATPSRILTSTVTEPPGARTAGTIREWAPASSDRRRRTPRAAPPRTASRPAKRARSSG